MDLETTADILAQKIKHLIITSSGHTSDLAPLPEFYQAFSLALREELMINWTATLHSIEHKKPRILYFLSMEYLPGRILTNTLANIGAIDLIKRVLVKLNRNFAEVVDNEPDPGLGHGGLGRLASCFLDSLATMQYPARGYGLRYQYGIFEQEIWGGKQIEKPDCWLLNANPWEVRRDIYSMPIRFGGKIADAQNQQGVSPFSLTDYEEIRALPYDIPIVGYHPSPNYSVITLRLWSTKESPRNFELQRYNAGFLAQAAENTSLTDVLYPNDNTELGKRVRLKQEYLLAAASLKDIIRRHLKVYPDMSEFADKVRIQINDTHPALVIAELMRLLTQKYNFSWDRAFEATQAVCSYTNHTILHEGLEEWKEQRVQELLPRQHEIIQRLNLQMCNQVRQKFPEDEARVQRMSMIENGQIRMAHLAIYGSHKVNGVAELHSQILKKEFFHDFYEFSPEKFTNVTNGISQRRWLLHANPLLSHFITQRIGKKWIADLSELSKLAPFASDPTSQKEFLEIKRKNKEALLAFLKEKNPIRDNQGKPIAPCPTLSSNALFDVHIKRFHEYKRQLMNLLHLIMIYQEHKANPSSSRIARFAIFAGKAAPGYEMAKLIIELTCFLSRLFQEDRTIQNRLSIAFLENYNVTHAEMIIPAADLSEQISPAGWEASGTGNMKLSLNGALTIGTEDGSTIEMHQAITDRFWPFSFGSSAKEIAQPFTPMDIYTQNEPIRNAVDFLKENGFGKIHEALLTQDSYRVLKDLQSYFETQKKIETLYLQPLKWAEITLHNIAGTNGFSSDHSISCYAKQIWQITPCPPDPVTLSQVREEYSEHDRCCISRPLV